MKQMYILVIRVAMKKRGQRSSPDPPPFTAPCCAPAIPVPMWLCDRPISSRDPTLGHQKQNSCLK